MRKVAGIEFPGLDPSAGWIIGEVEMREQPEIGTRREGGGIGPVNRVEGGGPYGVVLRERDVEHDRDPTVDDLRDALIANLGESGDFDTTPWTDRVHVVDASYAGRWELPVIGEVDAPSAVVIRPDGHGAWTGALTDPELPCALSNWFGAADDHEPEEHRDRAPTN